MLLNWLYDETLVNVAADPWWGWVFLGRMHPLVVHFPVSLLLLAAVMELATLRNFHSRLRGGINWLVYIGAGGSLLAAGLGWLLAATGSYAGDTFERHEATGIATAVLSMLTALLLWAALRKGSGALRNGYRAMLLLSAVGVTVAGHYGGSLTHGQDYLVSVTPWGADGEVPGAPEGGHAVQWASFAGVDSLTEQQETELNLGVRTILAHHCFQCHSSDKTEGKLRLDQKDLVFKGGESGPVIVPGNAQQSELVRRIQLPPGHKEAMPGKGKPLDGEAIALIKLWIDKGAPWPDQATSIFRVAPLAPRQPALPPATAGLTNPVDLWVNAYFGQHQVAWAEPVDDRTYLRRVYFDVIGVPPTQQQLEAFQADPDVDKRGRMVDALLAMDEGYATHWTSFWNDLLRNDYTGTGYITNGRFNISAWLYGALANNKPYDQLVRELLDPDESSKGFIRGIQWRGAVNSSQTTAMQAAQNVSQALLGVNLKCASCHDSFVSDWKLDDAYAFANIFSEQPLEINRCDIPTGQQADTRVLWPELGAISKTATVQRKSAELAGALTKPENGRLARTLVNRIWAQLMGRGIVSPTDEMDNEPWSQDLLDWLAADFVENGYDMKKLLFLVLTSKTYQQPSVVVDDPAKVNAPGFVFTGALKRKLAAEQFADAVSAVVHPMYPLDALKFNPHGSAEAYGRANPFVRAAWVQNDPFLTALGRPSRENITSVREGQATLLQAMELTNGALLNETLAKGATAWAAAYSDPDALVQALYLRGVGRLPTAEEGRVAKGVFEGQVSEEAVQDLLWAMVLLPEFQFID